MQPSSTQRKFHKLAAFFLGIALVWPTLGHAAYDKDTYAKQRQDFLAAEKALKARQITRYRRLTANLKDYPLYPYLKYREMHKNLGQIPAREIREFLVKYRHSPLADKMRHSWLTHLARTRQWQTLADNFYLVNDTGLKCHYARALIELGDQRAEEVTRELWRTGRSLPTNCNFAFDTMRKTGALDDALVWERIRLTMSEGKPRLANFLARKMLGAEDQKWVELWTKVRRKPDLLVNVEQMTPHASVPVARWAMVDGIRSLARRDEIKATEKWLELEQEYPFTLPERHRAERMLVYKLMQRNDTASHRLLKKLRPSTNDNNLQHYYILSALRDEDWKSALDWLGQLSPEEQHNPRWQYWRARSLEALGHLEEARGLYLLGANDRNYYSFLSADRAGLTYEFANRPIQYSRQDFASLKEEPALLRAGELFFLKRIVQARREWNHALTQMDQVQLLKAARLAHELGWHDRAILTLAQAEYWDDLEMRFPLAHQNLVLKHAKNSNINPAWAFAIIRQESAFTADARSHAGALGLMQLMPRTARQVARSLRLKRPRHTDILNIKTNVKLGVRYLKKVHDKFDGNPVLATAAYNAGDYRVKQWIPDNGVIAADVWVELVPFNETRDYLQRVMAYMVIYEKRLGLESVPLIKRMLPIQGKNPLTALTTEKGEQPLVAALTDTNI
ncbi:MAG: transglycosylase SLT domain-containing protein [Gammaproteobacteria bacterium]|nr:transglycosylase SLT domain-containing protein [Gammaproteobacteria bacterium]MDH5651719.1 transglycosylase SLT domain-containing protein [Gammaproteobacteria bacterium]